jgi:ribosomal protein S18 acetylase RimI-like enzyme
MTDFPYTLKDATRDDLGTVRKLADTIWRQHYPGIISEAQIDYMLERNYSMSALTAFIAEAGGGMLLACLRQTPIGFAAYFSTDDMTELQIDRLYVLPEHQGKGVGRRLIDRIGEIARMAGFYSLTLNVNKQNKAALAAYERNGFRIRDSIVNDIGHGFVMDDYVMEKTLPRPVTSLSGA